jgi:hypothetical protein
MKKIVKKFYGYIVNIYFAIRCSPYVLRLFDFIPVLLFRSHSKLPKSTRVTQIVESVRKSGYCQIFLKDFLDTPEVECIFVEAGERKNALEKTIRTGVYSSKDNKDFLFRLSSVQGKNAPSKLWSISVDGFFREVANQYFTQKARITNIDYWVTPQGSPGDVPRSSQLWHRDYEDKRVLKIFVYFTDVDIDSGALSYIEKSHSSGDYGCYFPTKPPLGRTVSDSELELTVPLGLKKTFVAPRGTVLFVDTGGLHKGGYCPTRERFLFTATYTSAGGISKSVPLTRTL